MKIGRFTLGKRPGDAQPEDEYNDPPRPFMEHLMDLRDCLIHCAVTWVVSVIVVIPLAPHILKWMQAPVTKLFKLEKYSDLAGRIPAPLQTMEATGGFEVLFKIMLWGGTTLSLPLLFFFVSRFVFPGLKRSERTIILFCLFTSTFLFLGGVWMAYSATLSIALDVLLKVNRWMNMDLAFFNTMPYITLVMKTLVAFGLAFQMPLLLLALGWFGIITSKMLAQKWRLAIVIVFILAMVLTPPDPVSQIVMAIPMLGLYWLCIWLIRLRELAKGVNRDGNRETSDGK
ncbi:MAG: twin-arginine translocase subunit TatC [Kiritimatiellae bacterium]|nr:twin-arginine translocase subunit TatC [Kiritimatiellia bacterium]